MKRLSIAVLALGALLVAGSTPAHAAQACAGLQCAVSSAALLSCDEGGSSCPICQRVDEPVRGYVCTP